MTSFKNYDLWLPHKFSLLYLFVTPFHSLNFNELIDAQERIMGQNLYTSTKTFGSLKIGVNYYFEEKALWVKNKCIHISLNKA